MEPFILAGTDDTPDIIFDKDQGKFEISGRSLPENVIEFYTPVFKWMDQYVADPNEETLLKVKIVYFNSSSQRALNELFTILSRIKVKGKDITVEWNFHEDDEEMQEAGEEYEDISDIPFVYKSYLS